MEDGFKKKSNGVEKVLIAGLAAVAIGASSKAEAGGDTKMASAASQGDFVSSKLESSGKFNVEHSAKLKEFFDKRDPVFDSGVQMWKKYGVVPEAWSNLSDVDLQKLIVYINSTKKQIKVINLLDHRKREFGGGEESVSEKIAKAMPEVIENAGFSLDPASKNYVGDITWSGLTQAPGGIYDHLKNKPKGGYSLSQL
jgi:hypothetical protein